ncbi:MAG: hypothetical protein C3F02_04335 [Parcubacteria group bacterium]|nr:MAG: hypothetical protein C3F02_04335 [Parcubacteria group bacterium]
MLYLGSDHNGYAAKVNIKAFLTKNNIAWKDLGNAKFDKNDDYTDWAKKVAQKISFNPANQGLLFCGSGQGMAMMANRFKNVRAIVGYSTMTVKHGRLDEDSNVLCLPVWDFNQSQMEKIIMLWVKTPFSGLARHCRRIKKLA